MFKLNCHNIPQTVTDYAFDHLTDDVTDDVEIDYEKQTVVIDTGNMKLASEVEKAVQSRSIERISDMESELNRGYDVGLSEAELEQAKTAVHTTKNFELTTIE